MTPHCLGKLTSIDFLNEIGYDLTTIQENGERGCGMLWSTLGQVKQQGLLYILLWMMPFIWVCCDVKQPGLHEIMLVLVPNIQIIFLSIDDHIILKTLLVLLYAHMHMYTHHIILKILLVLLYASDFVRSSL